MVAELRVISGGDDAMQESDPVLDDVFSLMKSEEAPHRGQSQYQAGANAVERAMLAEARRGGYRKGALGALAVAAAVSMGFFFGASTDEVGALAAGSVKSESGTVMYRQESSNWAKMPASGELPSGATVKTADASSVNVVTPWGASVAIKSTTVLEFPSAEEGAEVSPRVVRLLSGSVELDVPPLGPDETFAVHTKNHQVVVHGTQFSVTVAEEGAAPCVVVNRGVVEVKGPSNGAWLSAGQSSGCQLPEEEYESEKEASEKKPSAKGQARKVRTSKSRAKKEESSLAAQNRIFQSALSAERSGDFGKAASHLDQLLTKYPNSPLAGQARAQKKSLARKAQAGRDTLKK